MSMAAIERKTTFNDDYLAGLAPLNERKLLPDDLERLTSSEEMKLISTAAQ